MTKITARILASLTDNPMQPDFLIIGAQKAGTTSLYAYLTQHPQILSAKEKEVHFFDLNFDRGTAWYESQFEIASSAQNLNHRSISGEATPYYLFHPCVPQRVYNYLPQVKLIVLLRNPMVRAISHYHHEVRLGFEQLSIEQAIEQESTRLQGEVEKLLSDDNYYSYNHQHYSYLSRGIYIEQLKVWMSLFPKEQFLILSAEDLYSNPAAIFKQVLEFLNLPDYELKDYGKYNAGTEKNPSNHDLEQQLTNFFQPYNQQLNDFLGLDFNWDF